MSLSETPASDADSARRLDERETLAKAGRAFGLVALALEDGFFEMGIVCSFVFLLDVVVFGAFREKLASGSSDSGWALGFRCFCLDLGWLEELSVPSSLLRVFRGCCRIVTSTDTTSSRLGEGDLSGEDIVISLSSNAFELVGTKRDPTLLRIFSALRSLHVKPSKGSDSKTARSRSINFRTRRDGQEYDSLLWGLVQRWSRGMRRV